MWWAKIVYQIGQCGHDEAIIRIGGETAVRWKRQTFKIDSGNEGIKTTVPLGKTLENQCRTIWQPTTVREDIVSLNAKTVTLKNSTIKEKDQTIVLVENNTATR